MHYLSSVHHSELQRAVTLTELAPRPYFPMLKIILLISICLQGLMNFNHYLFKILKNNQGVTSFKLIGVTCKSEAIIIKTLS